MSSESGTPAPGEVDGGNAPWPEGHLWRAHAPGHCECDPDNPLTRPGRACAAVRHHLAEALRASLRVSASPASETPGPGEGDLRGARARAFRDAEHAMRRARQAWQKDGGDPCRVRVLGGVADTLAAWADGRGRPDDPAAAWRRDAAEEQRTLAEQKVARVEAVCAECRGYDDWPCPTIAALADPEADRGMAEGSPRPPEATPPPEGGLPSAPDPAGGRTTH